jgi:hypothetical protein
MKSGVFTSVPFFVGAAVIILTNWIGDKILTPQRCATAAGASWS